MHIRFLERQVLLLLCGLSSAACLGGDVSDLEESAPSALAPGRRPVFGTSLQQHPNSSFLYSAAYSSAVSSARRAGFTMNYLILYWNRIQPTRDAAYDWSRYDFLVRLHRDRGITPVMFLWYPPRWASSAPTDAADEDARVFPPLEADVADPNGGWQSFVRAAVERYENVTDYWFILHEPDHHVWMKLNDPACRCSNTDVGSCYADACLGAKADVYSRLVEVTAPLIRLVDPDAKIGISLSPDGLTTFFERLTPSAQGSFDVLRFGTYRQNDEFYPLVDRLAAIDLGRRERWLELGVREDLWGAAGQGWELRRRLGYARNGSAFDKIILFRLLDGDPQTTPFPSQIQWLSLGIASSTGEEKPSYAAVADFIRPPTCSSLTVSGVQGAAVPRGSTLQIDVRGVDLPGLGVTDRIVVGATPTAAPACASATNGQTWGRAERDPSDNTHWTFSYVIPSTLAPGNYTVYANPTNADPAEVCTSNPAARPDNGLCGAAHGCPCRATITVQ